MESPGRRSEGGYCSSGTSTWYAASDTSTVYPASDTLTEYPASETLSGGSGSERRSDGSDNILSDQEYYDSHQAGFCFDDSESIHRSGSSKLSSIRRNENLNHYELLQCDGLNEVAENTLSSMNLSSFSTPFKAEIELIHKSDKVVNPLDISVKEDELIPPTTRAVRDLVSGLDVNLTVFKALEDKEELLDLAVYSHDGNAILEVVLFLKNTLKKSLFQRELVKYPNAVNTYLSYLEEENETDELANMLLFLDRPEEAAVFKYAAAISVQNPERKSKRIQNCINTHFQPGVVSTFLRESALEHKICLAEQIALKEHQVTSKDDVDRINKFFEKLTGRKSLSGSSALDNLVFSCLNFYKVPSIAPISPESVKDHYKLSSRQYAWCALRVLAAQKLWSEIPEIFFAKNWTGAMKFRYHVGMVQLVNVLSNAKAPDEVMEKYISFVEKTDIKLKCAKKYKCHSIALEILKKTRDREGLKKYIATLPPNSPEYRSATAALNQSGVNWKN